VVTAAASVMACRHFFAAVGVDSDKNHRLAFLGRDCHNARICLDHRLVGGARVTARVASDPALVHTAVVFLNVSAYVGKEENAKVTETDALSMRVNLKDANRDSSDAVGTDRSI
jgi:hypothetical protein